MARRERGFVSILRVEDFPSDRLARPSPAREWTSQWYSRFSSPSLALVLFPFRFHRARDDMPFRFQFQWRRDGYGGTPSYRRQPGGECEDYGNELYFQPSMKYSRRREGISFSPTLSRNNGIARFHCFFLSLSFFLFFFFLFLSFSSLDGTRAIIFHVEFLWLKLKWIAILREDRVVVRVYVCWFSRFCATRRLTGRPFVNNCNYQSGRDDKFVIFVLLFSFVNSQ